MEKKFKQFLPIFLCATLFFLSCPRDISAEAAPSEVALLSVSREFIDAYSMALSTQSLSPLDSLLVDNKENDFFKAFLQWRFAIMQNMNSGYSKHICTIAQAEPIRITSECSEVKVIFNENFTYINGGTGYAYYNEANIQITSENGNYKISNVIFPNENDFYQTFCRKMSTLDSSPLSLESSDIKDNLALLISETENLGREMNAIAIQQTPCISEPPVEPVASTYYYVASRGVQYASTYGQNVNPYFYNYSNDCTNFVSQCIWAAYGGWSATMSVSDMQSNIANHVRMVPYTWQGGPTQNDCSTNWINVDSLWNYVTSNQGNGPKATGYNNGNWYTGVLPIDISIGDVLQRSSDGSDYSHSVYVVYTPGGSNPAYNEIYVAQHSSNYTRRNLSEVIAGGCYLRQLRFLASTFTN